MALELLDIYHALLRHYGPLQWWPARTPYEVMVGAVLVQNTAWGNVEKAIANFGNQLNPSLIANVDLVQLKEIIRPAGFHNQKALYLKAVTAWFGRYRYDVDLVRARPLLEIRTELLAVNGVGNETADSILLYAFGYPTFVIDAYATRLCARYPIPAGHNYLSMKRYFEAHLPTNAPLFNEFHAQIVEHGKTHCRKTPICTGCPLFDTCARIF